MDHEHRISPLELLCTISRLVYERELTDLCGGNVSLRHGGRVYITPTCAAQYFLWNLTPDDLVVLEPDGTIVQGDDGRLSRENDLHLRIYREQAAIGSVFHLHTVELMAVADRRDLLDGPIRDYLHSVDAGLSLLEPDLVGQTPEHDDRLMELLGSMDPARPTMIVAPLHGVFSTAPDTGSNLAFVDGLVNALRDHRLVEELRGARA
ncbi:MAG: class II aldolase/adducin family protein [Spirochaetota bacterium]